MVKRARKAKPPATANRTRPLIAVLTTLGVAAAVLFALSWAGDAARQHIGARERYAVRFADIRCDPPPGTSRDTFLAEVRYAASAAPTFQALDPDLTSKLSGAFAMHPWVASVDGVTVEDSNAVSVKLTYRVPVLAIGTRAVDAKGVLLPATAPTAGMPELLSAPALPPDAQAGKPWPGDAVVGAAKVAAEYKPRTIARTPQGWQLVMPDGKKLVVAAQ